MIFSDSLQYGFCWVYLVVIASFVCVCISNIYKQLFDFWNLSDWCFFVGRFLVIFWFSIGLFRLVVFCQLKTGFVSEHFSRLRTQPPRLQGENKAHMTEYQMLNYPPTILQHTGSIATIHCVLKVRFLGALVVCAISFIYPAACGSKGHGNINLSRASLSKSKQHLFSPPLYALCQPLLWPSLPKSANV